MLNLPSLKLLGMIIAGDSGVSIAFFPSVSSAFTTRKTFLFDVESTTELRTYN
jgi:hypothetical protein